MLTKIRPVAPSHTPERRHFTPQQNHLRAKRHRPASHTHQGEAKFFWAGMDEVRFFENVF